MTRSTGFPGVPGPLSPSPPPSLELRRAGDRTLPKSPVLRSGMLRRHAALPPSLDKAASFSLWYSGRTAIYQGVRRLGLPAGGLVLVPAYCCGSEVDALLRAGLSVEPYPLKPDLSPDLDELDRLAGRGCAAIYLVHYFGVVQDLGPVLEIASRTGARIVEDAALCLYGRGRDGTPVGHGGDIGIFSLVKFLPFPDGGVLVERAAPERQEAGRGPDWRAVLGRTKGVIRASAGLGTPGRSVAVPTAEIGPTEALGGLEPGRAAWTISSLSRALLRHWDHARTAETRCRNAGRLASLLEAGPRVRPLFPHWPADAVPPFFPVVADEPEAFHAYLKASGVDAVRFWYARHPSLALDRFPFESGLKHSVIRLPVHQDLDGNDLDRVARLVNGWNAGR
jgi:perosamine synthetase